LFREMRRIRQLMSAEETQKVLDRCTNGILACQGDDDYPYAVPLSYACANGKIYFHSAKAGHKVDAILKNPKVSFTVVDEDTIVSAEYTTYFRSVIAFGRARIAEDEERLEGFRALVDKYSGDQPKDINSEKIRTCDASLIVAIDVEHITGKEAIEYVRAKQKA